MKIYVCTVGTGTAGRNSNVAEGIMAAVKYSKPDLLVLIPSNSENSLAVAEIVAEGCLSIAESQIEALSDADNLDLSRTEIAEIINKLKKEGEIILNPTSGTKQMTTAAVLAAIDQEIPTLEYITGPREDGVIITGKEKIAKLDARNFIAEKYYKQTITLIKSNSSKAAAILIEPYKDIYEELYNAAEMFYYWHRFDYTSALKFAIKCKEKSKGWNKTIKTLSTLKEAETLSLERIADIINYTTIILENQENEEALAVIYRLVEMCAKLRLKELHIDTDNLTDFAAITGHPNLKIPPSTLSQLKSMGQHDNYHLGLRLSLEILASTDFAFYRNFMKNKKNWSLLQQRNYTRYGHGMSFVKNEDVKKLYDTLISSINYEWPEIKSLLTQLNYPNLKDLNISFDT